MYEPHIAFARQALAAGNLAACEILCRDVLGADPNNARALNLLGIVAAAVGAREKADGYFSAASSILPGNTQLRVDLETFRGIPAPRPMPDARRYLLIKAWGYGFWADVAQVLGCLLLAEITGRTPVIHWGINSLFSDGSARDAFTQYFRPVSSVTLADLLALPEATHFPPKWNGENLGRDDNNKWLGLGCRAGAVYFLNRPEIVAVSDFYIGIYDVMPWIPRGHALSGKSMDEIYRALIDKYLKPQPAITDAVEKFHQANLSGAPFVAVHLRGSDKIIEDENMAANNDAILALLDTVDPGWRIFLLTDDAKLLEMMKARYGARLIATDCQRTDSELGTHYRPEQDRALGGFEMMTDTYLALRADAFIGNGQSNVAGLIAVLKDWPSGAVTLVGGNQLAERKLPLFIKTF